ncbi:hypothetical protein GGF50DRAFT_88082 [Schizophyllum commune]
METFAPDSFTPEHKDLLERLDALAAIPLDPLPRNIQSAFNRQVRARFALLKERAIRKVNIGGGGRPKRTSRNAQASKDAPPTATPPAATPAEQAETRTPAGMVIVDPLLDAAELDFMFDVAPTAADDVLLAGLLADISNDTTFAADLGEADPPLRQSAPSILSPPFPTPAPAPGRNARQIAISSPDAHDARTLGATLNELVPHAQPTASQFPAQTTQTSVDAPRRDLILDRGIARVRQLNEQGTLPPEVSQMMEETIASALEGPRILSDDDVVRVQYWMHRLFGN